MNDEPLPQPRSLRLWLLPGAIAALACSLFTPIVSPTPEDCASATEPTEADVKYALAFTEAAFESEAWERSYSVESQRVSVTWLNNNVGALAHLEYLIYSCGYTQADVAAYYSERNFEEIIFQDYQDMQRTATCAREADKLTLHEFTGQVQGQNYLIRYWIKLDNETRILDMLLAFPPAAKAQLDRYAARVFPSLSSCQ